LEYARQDRKLVAGEAIAPKLLLRCIRTAGATRFVTLDLHNQAEAAFSDLDSKISWDDYQWQYKIGYIYNHIYAGLWFVTCLIFPYIGNVIIPTDFHIFQRG
jgi:hypothetical protein